LENDFSARADAIGARSAIASRTRRRECSRDKSPKKKRFLFFSSAPTASCRRIIGVDRGDDVGSAAAAPGKIFL